MNYEELFNSVQEEIDHRLDTKQEMLEKEIAIMRAKLDGYKDGCKITKDLFIREINIAIQLEQKKAKRQPINEAVPPYKRMNDNNNNLPNIEDNED